MPSDFGRDIPIGRRQLQKLASSKSWATEQAGSRFMQEWGGPGQYSNLARMPESERVTYFAVEEGYSTEADISDVTGLSRKEVSKAIGRLERKGLVARQESV